MKYWLSNGDGQSYGPYTIEELRGFAAEGRVTNMTQLCQEGTQDWVSATTMLGVGLGGTPPIAPSGVPPIGVSSGASAYWQPVSIVGPILAILFCCLPAGIVSLVYATTANTKAAGGDMAGAEAAKKSSALWLRLAVIPTIVILIVYIVIGIVAGVTGR
ncbi:MAG: hypothetical protein RLY21_566 [Planctomycetota bacterium]|jgi:hypothetical protein